MIQGIRVTVKATNKIIDVRKHKTLNIYINCNNKSETFKPEELKL